MTNSFLQFWQFLVSIYFINADRPKTLNTGCFSVQHPVLTDSFRTVWGLYCFCQPIDFSFFSAYNKMFMPRQLKKGDGGFIRIRGARVHNLKNIDIDIPKNKLVVITGLSGSGKSSLAFDTIYAEAERRFVESLSSYARQFLGIAEKPDVDEISGLSPAIAIDQKSVSKNPRSTVGTITEIYDYLRILFARAGMPHCPK